MRRLLSLIVFALFFVGGLGPASAAFDWRNGWNVRPMGYQQITSATLATATALTAPSKDKANAALIQCESVAVRYRDDGTDPTASVGMLLQPGEVLVYTGDLAAIKFIRTAAGSAINVTYFQNQE